MYFKKIIDSMAENIETSHVHRRLHHISESYKNIRANLLFALAGKQEDKAKTIMFTSAEQGDGKTTTCLNLAAAFADSGANVLVIDADLRRPRLERYLYSEKKRKGLSDVLGGFEKLSDVIVRPSKCNFDCLFSGSIPPNPSEILMLESVGELFEEVSQQYDYIFVDTPPVGIVSETLYLTQFVTGVVLVSKKRKTHLRKIQDAVDSLNFAHANILGIVLNGSVDSMARTYYRSRDKYYYYY